MLDRAVQLDSNNAVSHHLHASALAMMAKSEQAELAYKRTIELNPNLPKVYLGLGHVLKTLGKQEEGVVAYRKTIELQPNLGEAPLQFIQSENVPLYRRRIRRYASSSRA